MGMATETQDLRDGLSDADANVTVTDSGPADGRAAVPKEHPNEAAETAEDTISGATVRAIVRVRVADVVVPAARRAALKEAVVVRLMRSIVRCGLISPIRLTRERRLVWVSTPASFPTNVSTGHTLIRLL